jgi:hypothetical protein
MNTPMDRIAIIRIHALPPSFLLYIHIHKLDRGRNPSFCFRGSQCHVALSSVFTAPPLATVPCSPAFRFHLPSSCSCLHRLDAAADGTFRVQARQGRRRICHSGLIFLGPSRAEFVSSTGRHAGSSGRLVTRRPLLFFFLPFFFLFLPMINR